MAPTVAAASLLFHPKPKKKIAREKVPTVIPKSLSSTPPTPPQPEEETLQLPDGPFQEFRLMSSALNGWKYDVMKFDSRKPIDISTWQTPIKLNRKEPYREDAAPSYAPEAAGPMLGPDGKPVIGADGRVVMVDVEGRPIHASEDSGGGWGKDAKSKPTGRKKFQKKTRQVFYVPETTRQLRREERYPWVMEDSSQKEVWVGKMEEVSKSETHAFFMPAANDVFKFVPAHRWYKFQKKPNYHIPSLEEAESIMAKHQKNKDPERWLLHNRNGKAPSAATSAIFKAETEGRALSGGSAIVYNAGHSLGPGGRKLKTVDSGVDALFGDDEDEGAKKRRAKEYGGEGDVDEMLYENDFADDEEKVEEDNEDEEAKELEERLKREYKNANKQRDGYVDASDEEEDEGQLTKDGKAMKKLIRNLEKNNAYDSDEEKNPYASSEEEEEQEPPPPPPPPPPAPVPTEPVVQQPQPGSSRSGSQTPKTVTPTRPQTASQAGSRAASPTPAGMGGHSVVAKRATSPKAPKMKTNNASRGTSPLSGSQPTSPATGSRATSPAVAVGVGSRAGSPSTQSAPNGNPKANNKRKATEDMTGGNATSNNGSQVQPKAKKRKSQSLNSSIPAGELEDRMVIEWLRTTANATTRDCIQHFTPYLTDEAKKSKFTALVKEVAQLKGGVLVLRNAYRGTGSVVTSPAATPAA